MKPVWNRPASRAPLAAAFALAAAIHISALAFAPAREPAADGSHDEFPDIDIVDPGPEDPAPEPPAIIETPVQTPTDQPNEFTDAPEPSPRQIPRATKPVRAARAAPARSMAGNAKLLAINAPRPAYPYEARRQHRTGSGMALVDVDSRDGSVLGARIVQSTGSSILDNSAISAFRRWRFRAGSPSSVKIPFTFTMYGVQF